MYRACHEICTSRFTKCCACYEICTSRFTKRCTCHEICTSRLSKCCPATKSAHLDSHSAAPATKSAHRASQSAAPATKSAHRDSQSAAPATQSAHRDSQSAAPATKSAHRDSQSAAPATNSAHRRSKKSKLHEAFANFEMRFRNAVPATKSCLQVIRNAALATQNHPKVKVQKCDPSHEFSRFTSKYRIHGADSLRLPRETQSCERHTPANVFATSTKHCACHEICKVSDSLHLPRKMTFSRLQCVEFLAPATQNALHVRKRARHLHESFVPEARKPRPPLYASLRSRNGHEEFKK